MAQRKHAELIKQWADDDSLTIQCLGVENWFHVELSALFTNPDEEYRIKPTKPSIDWSHVADEYKWLATDKHLGKSFLYADKPEIGDDEMWLGDSDWSSADSYKSFKRGTCDWKDSLVMRPEGE